MLRYSYYKSAPPKPLSSIAQQINFVQQSQQKEVGQGVVLT